VSKSAPTRFFAITSPNIKLTDFQNSLLTHSGQISNEVVIKDHTTPEKRPYTIF